jgi:cyclopropane-fatty-acyl-phospholipid synthase
VIDDDHYERSKHTNDFVKEMVFPGSTILSVGSIVAAATRAGLFPSTVEDIGTHYVHTVANWRERFLAAEDRVRSLGFDEAFVRLWDLCLSLAYCQAGFAEQRISDIQMVLTKPDHVNETP